MKLRNKKTEEIGYLQNDIFVKRIRVVNANNDTIGEYNSLAELNAEWEDAPEEPFSTSFYTIVDGEIKHCVFYRERVAGCPDDAWAYIKDDGRESINHLKAVGLYFEAKEEAEKAVEKLNAWKRLKDKGFRFDSYDVADRVGGDAICGQVYFKAGNYDREEIEDDLYLLFGGEE